MKSLEELEIAFSRGLSAWESEIVEQQAKKIGSKIVREIKRGHPFITGNMRRRWAAEANVSGKGQDVIITITNDADYAAAVNNGHRIVRGGKTVGKKDGFHMLEKGVERYKANYLQDDLQEMADQLKGKMI